MRVCHYLVSPNSVRWHGVVPNIKLSPFVRHAKCCIEPCCRKGRARNVHVPKRNISSRLSNRLKRICHSSIYQIHQIFIRTITQLLRSKNDSTATFNRTSPLFRIGERVVALGLVLVDAPEFGIGDNDCIIRGEIGRGHGVPVVLRLEDDSFAVRFIGAY